ncbi:APC family permease [[Eubacterium] cellulosolvens]
MKPEIGLRRQLNTFDVTSLVIGSTIGADIYIAVSLGASLVGPISLLVWIMAGVMAITIALSFSYCASLVPRVGGPYSYAKEGTGQFSGFIVGWALLLAEWFSLAVFPIAFAHYFISLFPTFWAGHEFFLKAFFILIILMTNIFSVKIAGKFNDLLTIAKLCPLLLIIVSGFIFLILRPDVMIENFHPLIKGNFMDLGQVLILIFWAYAGFELSTLPADEIKVPERTLPKAIIFGMVIVTIFFVITSFIVIGVVDQETLVSSNAPLITTIDMIFGYSKTLSIIGISIVGTGALISIMGADESGTIGTSRLAFAMSIDGLLPKAFSKLHRIYQTPYIGLILICSTAFIVSIASSITELINASVFLLAFVYLYTCFSTLILEKKYSHLSKNFKGKKIIPIAGILFSIILMTQIDLKQIMLSIIVLTLGIPIYLFFSPKKEIIELKQIFLSREEILKRAYKQGEIFLAYPIRRIKWLIYRIKRIEKAWIIN